jgi:Na+/H+-dicarboxylate symporter
VDIFPANPVASMAEGNMLQIIVFALLFGYAMSRAGEAGRRVCLVVLGCRGGGACAWCCCSWNWPRYGVFALLARLFAEMGLGAILDLGAYFLTVLGVLLLHGSVTYSILLRTLTGLPPSVMLRKMRSVWAFAFSTASSGATLPITLRTVEKKLGVSNSVAGFTMPSRRYREHGRHGDHAGRGDRVHRRACTASTCPRRLMSRLS